MKNLYLVLIFSVLAIAAPSVLQAAGKGWLITKDNKYITGQVLSVKTTDTGGQLMFRNDFGDLYSIHPFLIKGFAYVEKAGKIEYESKFNGQQWLFLQIEVAGSGIKMYRNETESVSFDNGDIASYSNTYKSTEIWLEKADTPPFRVYLVGFRKKLKKAVADYPELAKKIGTKGYRFRQLKEILHEYNEWYDATRIML